MTNSTSDTQSKIIEILEAKGKPVLGSELGAELIRLKCKPEKLRYFISVQRMPVSS